MEINAPRLMIAGTNSSCGKTTLTLALLQALKNRGTDVASFKCGPDYIDPMFHSRVIGAQSRNIDLFFLTEAQARSSFARHAGALNVIEGVMGLYDGLSMDSDFASSYHVARTLSAPIVLVVNARGMALSAAAMARGYSDFRSPSLVRGVIFNNVSGALYPSLKAALERETGLKALGYLPPCPECALESRHLGLVTAAEVENLRGKLQILAARAEESLDMEGLIALMAEAPPLELPPAPQKRENTVRVAIARDRAFCFYYADNLELLEEMGAELVPFSPLSDAHLPEGVHGLLLGGGYPELYAERLAQNRALLGELKAAIQSGLPTIAECGGFMLLTRAIDQWPMAGLFPTQCRDAGKLRRFGYATLSAQEDSLLFEAGDTLPGHEFHRWDADDPGRGLSAQKPSGRAWRCAYVSETLYAGYPHLAFMGHPKAARRFIDKCLERKLRNETIGY